MRSAWIIIAAMVLTACGTPDYLSDPPNRLSSYGLFEGDGTSQLPVDGVVPYSVNSELFSDYAAKRRFIRLPDGKPAVYDPAQSFEMPVGTILAKTFSYPRDMRDPSLGERLLETRLLIHGKDGWGGLTYVWNYKQTEAYLEVAGHDIVATWLDLEGNVQVNEYMVPNTNQCKQCHSYNDKLVPIGIRARHLNRDMTYDHGTENQVEYWSRSGLLVSAPEASATPRLANYEDPATGSLDERARAWLEVNCAHCHTEGGPSWSAGLDLMASQTDSSLFGVYKSPTAAGRGTGGHRYDIVPGKPDESILLYRISSLEPDVAMPELGRRMVHQEGVDLIYKWIASLR